MINVDSDAEVQKQFTLNQSRVEEITMKEDLGSITLAQDDGFGMYASFYILLFIHNAKSKWLLHISPKGSKHLYYVISFG